ncbi:MAG TPA: radical SAM protein [Clostridiales bacterium]|nr:radical SAM protein [Clostridiales bacterium]
MKSTKHLISSVILKEGLNYLEKDPINNFNKLLNWAGKIIVRPEHKQKLETLTKMWNDPNSTGHRIIERFFNELHPNVRRKFLTNYMLNSGILGAPIREKLKKKHDCNIPWAILMDPTSACNLNCTGCWAAEYSKTTSLSFEELDRIIREGKELGIYMYIYSGGEPLMRKDDLIELAKIHDDCMFLSFTNGTLVDEEFAMDLQNVGNFGLAISIEGFEEETDARRGNGTYQKVLEAMDILKEYGIVFGFSTCYHRNNTETIISKEYIDFLAEKGCLFGWYFTYVPIGKDAVVDLLVTPEQRAYMYHKMREIRSNTSMFLLDFWNDGEYVCGCIAGGRNYLHINSNGDVEPCAFVHYANTNIKETSLLEALKSPLFKEYRKHQPFNENHLRPCPMLDNPDILREMVNAANAHSTQPIDKESVEELTAKCEAAAAAWAVKADELWANR